MRGSKEQTQFQQKLLPVPAEKTCRRRRSQQNISLIRQKTLPVVAKQKFGARNKWTGCPIANAGRCGMQLFSRTVPAKKPAGCSTGARRLHRWQAGCSFSPVWFQQKNQPVVALGARRLHRRQSWLQLFAGMVPAKKLAGCSTGARRLHHRQLLVCSTDGLLLSAMAISSVPRSTTSFRNCPMAAGPLASVGKVGQHPWGEVGAARAPQQDSSPAKIDVRMAGHGR